MKDTQAQQPSIKNHIKALILFLALIIIIVSVFFCCVQSGIRKNTETAITVCLENQAVYLRNLFDIHYEYLENIASSISADSNIISDETIQLLGSLSGRDNCRLLSVITPDGEIHRGGDAHDSALSEEYFQTAMSGERSLSDPFISPEDGETRQFILAVPILRDGEIIGVLSGSYDISALSSLLVDSGYEKDGYILVVTQSGDFVCYEGAEGRPSLDLYNNFFAYYRQMAFKDSGSIEKVSEAFESLTDGITKIAYRRDTRYLTWRPLGLGTWMICYVLPVRSAQSSYQFILNNTILLFTALVLSMILYFFITSRTNTQKQQALLVYGQTDALTGAFNKKSTEEQIDLWLNSEQCVGVQAFLMIDIDNFKGINDMHGHAAGDEILLELGKLLRHEFRDDDIIGRIGGDEFCVLMRNIISETIAIARVESLCTHIREHRFKCKEVPVITSSIGVSFSPQHGTDFSSLYRCADTALYQTKRRGKNGYTVHKT